jgi:GTP-binding protein
VFALNDTHRLVDLPGYGYAKVPKHVQRDWGRLVERYLSQRKSLRGLILVIDIRRLLTDFDRQLLDWCQHVQMPVHILLTKADKLSYGPAKSSLLSIQQALSWQYEAQFHVQLFSALKRWGLEEAQARLLSWLEKKNAPVSRGGEE